MIKNTGELPPMIREYVDALNAWNLRAAQWLDLDAEAVFDLGITQDVSKVWGAWQSITPQAARVGDRGSLPTVTGDRVVHNGAFSITGIEAADFNDAVGPKPELVANA
jgi:hypothetical protein